MTHEEETGDGEWVHVMRWTEWALLRGDGTIAAGPIATGEPEQWASEFTPYPKSWHLHSRQIEATDWKPAR